MAGIDPIALAGISAGDSNTPPQYRRSSGGGSDEKPEGFARVPLMAPPATSGNGGDFRGWRPGDMPSTSSEAMCFAPMALRQAHSLAMLGMRQGPHRLL